MLVDSHCHLDFPELHNKMEEILQRAQENDVKILQTICTKISKFKDILAIANTSQNIFCSVGIHPLNVKDEGIYEAEKIIKLTSNNKVIGIGETGLDYYYSEESKNLQQKSLDEHIKAAQETGLPLIIHTRNADDDTINILKSAYKNKEFTGVIHCFTASKRLAYECIDIGFYISASGIITFKNAQDIRNVFMEIPLQNILIETDAPFLAPVPKRGKSNEPAFVKYIAEFLANLRNISYDELSKNTTDNFLRLFNKVNLKI